VSPFRRIVQALGFVVLALGALLAVLAVHGYGLVHGHEDRPLLPLRVRPDATLRERGRHLAEVSCVGCHSEDGSLPLAGGMTNFLHEPGAPALGELFGPNLTPGGRIARYSDAELGRIIAAVSKSRFWPRTAVIVAAPNAPALVISPFSRGVRLPSP